MRIDTDQIKSESEAIIIAAGGQVCDWLPYIEPSSLRNPDDVISRALILNAMLNISFGAPTEYIKEWLEREHLLEHLSPVETEILAKPNSLLSEQEKINLYWYIEALWATMWTMALFDTMDFKVCIPDSMAAMCPNLEKGEGPEKFAYCEELREYEAIYKERDLYYRLMWWARQVTLTGGSDPVFDMSRILERRRALEWIMNATLDWDNVPLDT